MAHERPGMGFSIELETSEILRADQWNPLEQVVTFSQPTSLISSCSVRNKFRD